MRNRTSENSMRNQTLNESVDETELSFLTNSLNLLRKENIEMGCTSCKHKQHQSVNDSCALSASQVHKTSNELTLPDVSAPYNNGFKSEISQTGLKASFRNPTLFEKTFGEEISKQSESKIVTDFATFPRTRKTAAVNGDIIHKSVIHNEQNELSQILFPDETLEQQINSATFPRSSKSKNLSRQEIIKFMTMIASSTYKPPPERQHLELKPDHSVENHSIQQQSSEIETMSKDSATQTDSWPSKCSVLNSLSWPKLLDCVSEDTEGNLSGEEMDLLLLRSSFKDTVLSSTPSLASISRDDNLKDEQINFYIQMKSCHSSKNSSLGLSECSAVFSLDDNCCDSQQQHPSFENDNRELLALESQSTETTQENCQKQLQIDSGKKLLQWKWNITKRPKSQSWPCLSLNRSESANTKRCYSENSVVIKNFYSIQVEGKVDVMSIFGKQPLQKMNFKSLSDSMLEKKDTIKNHETLVCCPQLARNTLAEEAFDVIYPSSQTKKERPEIEAQEACRWLRAAGFPQYAQLYEENQFPLDIRSVWKDHQFLDSDSFRALFRRLNTLNKCAKMKVDYLPRKSDKKEESDDEEQCALSENWKFQRTSQRWSRVPSPIRGKAASSKKSLNACNKKETCTIEEAFNSSSYDSVFVEDQHSSSDSIRQEPINQAYTPTTILMDEDGQASRSESKGFSTYSPEITLESPRKTSGNIGISLRRSGSEKLKNSAKTLLRRVESFTDRRKKKYSNESLVISAPWGFINMRRNWFPRGSVPDESPASSSTSSPRLLHRQSKDSITSDRISNSEDCSDGGRYKTQVISQNSRWHQLLGIDTNVFDSTESSGERINDMRRIATSSVSRSIGRFSNPAFDLVGKNLRRGTQDHKDDEKKSNSSSRCHLKGNQNVKSENCFISLPFEDENGEERTSVYDNLPEHPHVLSTYSTDRNDCCHTGGSEGFKVKEPDLIADLGRKTKMEEANYRDRCDSGVGSSLTRTSILLSKKIDNESHFPALLSANSPSISVDINSLSCIQLMKLRKLSLLKLTTFMEKHSPSSKTGWSWRVPNFIRRIRSPDYKGNLNITYYHSRHPCLSN
ncbi:rho GTPase-activating protein 7-like [Limulus polyphemus]|uniref:Rho GTPase-activating protein 7-like n=1 Tax=Limulus polyphemus TaxID=6850 RepID=A0ABM1S028_LIMPO|nr:rho GTPase-activating protein 7-like [Limulus polyphemus]